MYGELIPGVLRYPTHAAVFYGFASVAYFCSAPRSQPTRSSPLFDFPKVYHILSSPRFLNPKCYNMGYMTEGGLLFAQIEDLLRRARELVKKETGGLLDPTTANAQAKEYAEREENLARVFASRVPINSDAVDASPTGYSVTEQNIGEDTTVTVVSLDGYQAGGIGAESIRFLFFSKRLFYNSEAFFCYGERVGVNTQIYLYIGKHMDEPTRLEVEALLKDGQILPSSLNTIYVFDKEGNYGKISIFPKSVLDQRLDLWDHPSLKHVASEASTADFELVNRALSVLEEKAK